MTYEEIEAKISDLIEYEKTLPEQVRWAHFCEHIGPLMDLREKMDMEIEQNLQQSKWHLGPIG